ncbi:MAG TPA: SDR family NAD(P)-dependent oxidoreductase [Kofleriaceae bacterium]
MAKPVCVVAGIGPGNGAAFARRFAADGYAVALLARAAEPSRELEASLPDARAWQCDVGDAVSVAEAFDGIRGTLGNPEVVIYNAGSGAFGTFDDISAADFESSWRVNALGGFLIAKQVVPAMKRAGRGNLVFVGATASRRGAARTAAFAPAKAAQRSLAESLAKHLGPAGIHVSLIVIDGVVDLPRVRQRLPDKPDAFFVKPEDVAATAAFLVAQPRSAWTFELEARPFGETW